MVGMRSKGNDDDRTGAPIRVFLLDDHEIVRRGLRTLLEAEDDIEVVGEAGRVADAIPAILELRPDVAILDGRLPDGSGIEVPGNAATRRCGL